MIQKGTDPFCTILAASRYWGAVLFYTPPDYTLWETTFRGYAARSPALFYFATQKASLPDPKRRTPPF